MQETVAACQFIPRMARRQQNHLLVVVRRVVVRYNREQNGAAPGRAAGGFNLDPAGPKLRPALQALFHLVERGMGNVLGPGGADLMNEADSPKKEQAR